MTWKRTSPRNRKHVNREVCHCIALQAQQTSAAREYRFTSVDEDRKDSDRVLWQKLKLLSTSVMVYLQAYIFPKTIDQVFLLRMTGSFFAAHLSVLWHFQNVVRFFLYSRYRNQLLWFNRNLERYTKNIFCQDGSWAAPLRIHGAQWIYRWSESPKPGFNALRRPVLSSVQLL